MFQWKSPKQHERDYWKFVSELRRQSLPSTMSHLSLEHVREVQRAGSRTRMKREFQYKRIEQENNLLIKHIDQVRGRIATREECEKDWKRHIQTMKNMCHYPENIDRFVSKKKKKKKNK